jgi:CRISPR-associated protein Cmr5
MAKSSLQKLGQGRDAFAYEQAQDGCRRHRKEFPQAVKSVPMMIKNNGLGAAFAFMYSKQNTLGTVLKAIDAWLSHQNNAYTYAILKKVEGNNLVQKLRNLDSLEHRILTQETMAFLQLLRRFSEGIIKIEKQNKEDDMAKRQDTEGSRASFAYKQAEKGCGNDVKEKEGKEFSQAVKRIPMMIKINGLSEAFAFMYSKQGKHGTILKSIEEWLTNPNNRIHLILKAAKGENIVQKVTELNSSEYRTVTIETMAFLQWLRRFSEGITKEREPKKDKA